MNNSEDILHFTHSYLLSLPVCYLYYTNFSSHDIYIVLYLSASFNGIYLLKISILTTNIYVKTASTFLSESCSLQDCPENVCQNNVS